MSDIQGGTPQQNLGDSSQQWAAASHHGKMDKAQKSGSVATEPVAKKGEASPKKVLEQDSITSANNLEEGTLKDKEEARKAGGLQYATLSQPELDRSEPNHPKLLSQKGQLAANPPTGPTGTQNPFLNPNPMVAFFTSYLKMLQVQKEITAVSSKMAYNDILMVKALAKDQAAATIEAGKAQAEADTKQAYMSFASAGVSFGMAGATAGLWAKSAREKSAEEAATAKGNQEADKLGEVEQQSNTKQIKELETQIANKEKMLNPKSIKVEQIESETQEMEKIGNRESKGKEKLTNTNEEVGIDTAIKNEKATKKNKEEKEIDLADSLKQDQTKLDKLKAKNDKLPKEKGIRDAQLNAERLRSSGQRIQNAPSMMVMQAIIGQGGGMQQLIQGLQGLAKAKGEGDAAYYNAQAQQAAAFEKMIETAGNSAVQNEQDAYTQADELMKALQKMSDQEQSGMGWRTA